MLEAQPSQFRFVGHRVERLHFERVQGAATDGSYQVRVRFETEVVELGLAPHEGSQTQSGASDAICNLVTLRLWMEWEPSPGPFEFDLTVVGQFERDPAMTPETFREFSRISGPAVLFAHARPFVRTVMLEAGEEFRLPLINLRATLRKELEKEETSEDTKES